MTRSKLILIHDDSMKTIIINIDRKAKKVFLAQGKTRKEDVRVAACSERCE